MIRVTCIDSYLMLSGRAQSLRWMVSFFEAATWVQDLITSPLGGVGGGLLSYLRIVQKPRLASCILWDLTLLSLSHALPKGLKCHAPHNLEQRPE